MTTLYLATKYDYDDVEQIAVADSLEELVKRLRAKHRDGWLAYYVEITSLENSGKMDIVHEIQYDNPDWWAAFGK